MGGLTVTSVPRAKKYGPVVRVNVFHKTSVIVTSPESVKVGGAMSGAMSSFPWLVGDTGPLVAGFSGCSSHTDAVNLPRGGA